MRNKSAIKGEERKRFEFLGDIKEVCELKKQQIEGEFKILEKELFLEKDMQKEFH